MIIAGTGHRPHICPCRYKENHPWLTKLRENISNYLKIDAPEFVISGMAIGWDTWLAQEALKLNIPVKAYIPFEGQSKQWPERSRKEYERILSECKEIKYISQHYHARAFYERDEAMINDCNVVFSLWNPEINSGGTYYTIMYAKKLQKPIINFWS
jgi:uncharacterized phage-like protein YoqJ